MTNQERDAGSELDETIREVERLRGTPAGKVIDLMEALKASLATSRCGASAPRDDLEEALGLMSRRTCQLARGHAGLHGWEAEASSSQSVVETPSPSSRSDETIHG